MSAYNVNAGLTATENNRWVNFAGPPELLDRFADVVITEARPHSLRGRLSTAATDSSRPPCGFALQAAAPA